MIKFENTEVVGWEAAIRGMRNPKNSWERSDTLFDGDKWCLGDNDHQLMMMLRNAGTDHRKYLRMIAVYVDITAPLYWWSEYDTYKVGTVANSCSKMHKLLHKPFEMDDFSFDKLTGYKREVKQFRPLIDEDMVANEAWAFYDKDYDISNYGRVKHKFKNHYRIISGFLHRDGYIFVTLHGKQYALHRLVAKLWKSETYKDGLEVNHIDGNKQNNFANNLEWVTSSENQKHAVETGLQPRHSGKYTGKFSEEERAEIKKQWDSGTISRRELAKKYGVSHTCINDIVNDKYKYAETVNVFEEFARPIVDTLNELRDSYFRCSDEKVKKEIWYSILQILPESYNQKRTVMLNYEVLANIYKSRRAHKLDEWNVNAEGSFCQWIKTLPYSELITGEEVM